MAGLLLLLPATATLSPACYGVAWFGVWGTAHRPPVAEPGRGVTDDSLAVAEAGDPEVERGPPDSHTPTVVSAFRPADPPPV